MKNLNPSNMYYKSEISDITTAMNDIYKSLMGKGVPQSAAVTITAAYFQGGFGVRDA